MAAYTYPGIYIEEKPGGPGPITGVSTSILGLIGFSLKGEVNKPILCTSYPDFESKFGGFTELGLSPTEAYAFFANGGQQLYFVRVTASDAVDAYWDFNFDMTSAETVGNTAEGSGMYTLQLDNVPIVPGSLGAVGVTAGLTFANAGTPADQNVFYDDGAGNLVFDAVVSGATAAGGSGTIDYTTGEITVTLNDPSEYGGGADLITALYDYLIFRFQMKWPGAAGNFYRVRIQPGSDDFLTAATASWSRFTVLVDEDVNADATNRAWTTVETFSDLVLNLTTDPNYITTVINDEFSGSDLIEVVDYGNEMNPVTLAGTAVTAEDFSATQIHSDGSSVVTPDVYDGLWKGWQYTLAEAGCFETTFLASFTFEEGTASYTGADDSGGGPLAYLTDTAAAWTADGLVGLLLYNTTDGSHGIITTNTATTVTATMAGGTLNTWANADTYEIRAPYQLGVAPTPAAALANIVSPGNATTPVAITSGTVRITIIDDQSGEVIIVDNVVPGELTHGATKVGEIDYTTGQITNAAGTVNDVLDLAPLALEKFVAGSAIYMQCDYAVPVDVEDDGDGNLAIAATQAAGYPQKFALNAAGTNTVAYDTGVFILTWQITGAPAAGPAGIVSETVDYYTDPADEVSGILTSGADGTAVSSSDVVSASLAADQEGLYAFGQVDELMQLVASDFQTDTTVAAALITYAELLKDKFVILTVPAGLEPQEAVNWKKFQLNNNTSYAALYYPHIKITDPVSEVAADIPVGGHVAGVYARTDTTRNVSTAPGGTELGKLNWSIGLEKDLTPTQVGICDPQHINCLVQWPHTGRCVWGVDTLDIAGGEWQFIQERRLFMFLEKSVFRATHSHVFKNNGPQLWSAIRTQVYNFLLGLYQAGYFAGNSADQAFFVICDRTNNPQNTVDQGIVFCDIGVATTTPGKYIVFRFTQLSL